VEQAIEQPVLQRIGVLELVDHEHRVALRQRAGQRRPARAGERRGQFLQQAVEAAPPGGRQALGTLHGEVIQRAVQGVYMHGVPECDGRRLDGLDLGEHRVLGRSDTFLAGGRRQGGSKRAAGQALVSGRRHSARVAGPNVDVGKQRAQVVRFVAVVLGAAESLVVQQQRQRLVTTGGPGGGESVLRPKQRRAGRGHVQLVRGGQQAQVRLAVERLERFGQIVRPVRPLRVERRQRLGRGRVAAAAPEVAQDLRRQRRGVGLDVRLEAAGGAERVVGQRPAAEAVDGVHGQLVQAQQGVVQMRGRGRVVRQARHQRGEEFVRRAAGQRAARLVQAGGDALAQLGRRRLGEGDHQQLPRLAVVFEQLAQVQRGDGPGLAGAGAGLDQVPAGERQAQRVEVAHALSSTASSGRNTRSARATKAGSASGSRPRNAACMSASSRSPGRLL
jgi:hypothetical protein